ncbi:MAG: phosphatase PAP2 family protein [Thermoflexaceae bacterium]|nr:phosphatase PAP2 family protein [Thermoflexaceae bacterium]
MTFLELISNFRIDFLDTFFRTVSYFGEITILLPLLCIIYWCVSKSLAYKALFTYFISGSIVQGAKIVFRIPRPWILNPSFQPVESAMETATGYSFPSGHVQGSSSVFLSIATWSGNKILAVISYVITALVLISRMYLGVHTPLDVFTSLCICVAVVLILRYIAANYSFPHSNKTALLIIAIAYSIGLILYALLLVYWNVSSMELVSDSIVFACSLTGFSIGAYIEDRFIHFGTSCLSFFMQIIKAILGLLGLVLLNYAFSLIPAGKTVINSALSFCSCIWATCIFPLFIKLVQKKKYSEL